MFMMDVDLTWIVYIIMGAILLDLIIGDPRWLPHPVIGIGHLISFLEKKLNRGANQKIKGVALTFLVVGISALSTLLLSYVAFYIHWAVGIVGQIYLISTTIAIKGLKEAGLQVSSPLEQGNIAEARTKLSWIVGRDTEHLDEPEIARGAVETVAENTVDGITAPLFWALIGGAPLAMAYRAVNTLDSMVGYKNERYLQFGWASAKLDDLCNWLPARMTALAIWLSAWLISFLKRGTSFRFKHAMKVTLRDAPKHPSPNSGWPEAVVAGLLGIQLGGINYYQGVRSERARMGEPLEIIKVIHIKQTILLMHGGWSVFILLAFLVYLLFLLVIGGV